MPTTSPGGGGGLTPKNLKSITVSQAENGYVLVMQEVNEYGFVTKVATSIDEANLLIGTYFA